MAALLTGLDYRASPDWAAKLGYSPEGLAEMQARCIEFLTDLRDQYRKRVPHLVVAGAIGPRGDAYGRGAVITEAEAEDYHSVQLTSLKHTEAEMACALTFNNIPEAIGVIRAAQALDMPLALGLTLNADSVLGSGPTLREAIETVEERTDGAASFYVVNCSHPDEFEPALDGGEWQARIRCIRPNASRMEKIALCKLGHLEDGDPVELGEQMADVARRFPQMDIFGGCCGTDERHLDQIARRVTTLRG
jgi:S-methylmethionine-dependent homocysteine/selenocysteine methylase